MSAALDLPADDAELRASASALAELGARLGAPYAKAASAIRARLAADPGARRERDALIVALRRHWFDGLSNNEAAAEIARETARYEATAWRRGDRALSAPPPSAFGTAREHYWRILRASDGPKRGPRRQTLALAARTVREILDAAPIGDQSRFRAPTTRRMLKFKVENTATRSKVNAIPKFEKIVAEMPGFRDAERKAIDREVAERQAHLDAIERLAAEAEKSWPRHERLKADALEKVREAERALKFANDDLAKVLYAVSAERLAYENDRRQRESALIAGDWPELTAFRDRCHAEITTALQGQESREVARRNPVTGRTERLMVSNSRSIGARVVSINGTLSSFEILKLIADRRDLPARLNALVAAWPKVEPVIHPVDLKGAAA